MKTPERNESSQYGNKNLRTSNSPSLTTTKHNNLMKIYGYDHDHDDDEKELRQVSASIHPPRLRTNFNHTVRLNINFQKFYLFFFGLIL